MYPKRPSYVLYNGQCRAWRRISFAVVILQRRKVVKCVHFTGQRAISQKLNNFCNKTLRLALECVENCRSRVSFVAFMVRFWFKNLTVHTSFVQGSLFLLAVYTHKVPLCAPSFVAVIRCDWALRDIARLECGPRPELYPVTLALCDEVTCLPQSIVSPRGKLLQSNPSPFEVICPPPRLSSYRKDLDQRIPGAKATCSEYNHLEFFSFARLTNTAFPSKFLPTLTKCSQGGESFSGLQMLFAGEGGLDLLRGLWLVVSQHMR